MEEERVVVKAHDFDSWRAEKKEQRKKRVDPFSEDLFPTMESPKFQVVLHLQGDAFSWMPEVFATTLVHLLGAGRKSSNSSAADSRRADARMGFSSDSSWVEPSDPSRSSKVE